MSIVLFVFHQCYTEDPMNFPPSQKTNHSTFQHNSMSVMHFMNSVENFFVPHSLLSLKDFYQQFSLNIEEHLSLIYTTMFLSSCMDKYCTKSFMDVKLPCSSVHVLQLKCHNLSSCALHSLFLCVALSLPMCCTFSSRASQPHNSSIATFVLKQRNLSTQAFQTQNDPYMELCGSSCKVRLTRTRTTLVFH